MPATISDVALSAGVSTATVSRVLSAEVPVSEVTASKVRKAVEKLGYIPQTAARNLARRRTKAIGLILPSLAGDFFSLMLAGVEAVLAEEHYDLLVTTQLVDNPSIDNHVPLGKHNTDGLLVFTGNLTPPLLKMHQSGFPLVLLYQSSPKDLGIPCVTVENRNGTEKLIDHLIEVHGCKHIGLLRGPDGNEDSSWRELGFRRSLEKHGLTIEKEMIANGEFLEEAGAEAVKQWLEQGVRIDAVFGGSDEAAIGAQLALTQNGVRIPEQIKVVGFDDLTLARYMVPPLTTVRAPTEEVGRVAARKLLQLIRTGTAEALTLLPTELVIRHSCGC